MHEREAHNSSVNKTEALYKALKYTEASKNYNIPIRKSTY